ncbi:MAG: hypothetical protein L6Q49_15915 [Anaerolineales bacterium]|nr:hypothetical protein [Anaerolineales bacterium]
MKLKSITKIPFSLIMVFTLLMSACGGFPSATVTEEATATHRPTVTATLIPTLRPTATETSIPTLTSDEQLLQIKEWLATNAGCRLPCWWGIEPGKVTWGEVSEFLRRIGTKSSDYEESGVVIHEAVGFDFNPEHVFTRVGFAETDASITAIIIRAFGLNDSPNFKNVWASFSPEMIIAEYGVPSRVWVKSRSSVYEGSHGPTMPYWIWFFYDHLGILVSYNGQVRYENIYKMCPVFNEQGNLSDDIDIYLQSPEANIPLEDLPTVKYNAKDAIPLGEAAGISLDEFYELFTTPGIAPCFETPRSIWP